MSDFLSRNIDPIHAADLTADDVYKVKGMERDSGQSRHERFDEQLKKKKHEEEKSDKVIIGEESPSAEELLDVHDDLHLSSDVLAADEKSPEAAELPPEDESPPATSGTDHINLMA